MFVIVFLSFIFAVLVLSGSSLFSSFSFLINGNISFVGSQIWTLITVLLH